LDPYRILQVRPDAEDAVISAAYRALARRYHPDVVGETAARSMTEINAAYEILRDPVRRGEYDRSARSGGPSAAQGNVRHGEARTTRANASAHAQAWKSPSQAPHVGARPDRAGARSDHAGFGAEYGIRPEGVGAAGRPPGRPSGSVLSFGRHVGWSLGEIARVDPGYLEWLEGKPQGKPYVDEIDALLKRVGYRLAAEVREVRKGWLRRS
jgi:curved DNA-binding protein CbpA